MTTAAPPPKVELSEKEIIAGLQKTVSASRLSLFLQCRLKFYFRYVLKIKKSKTASLHVGTVVHSVLSNWHKARWNQKPLSLKEVNDAFQKSWADEQKGEPVKWDGDEQEQEKLTAWRLIETYLRESPIPPNSKPDAVEVPVEADLVNHGLPRLIGVLDLVQKGKIVDYKTSSTTPNADKVAHTTEIQTSTYAVLYRHCTGLQEQGIELHHLVKLKNPKLVITALPPMFRDQESRLYRLLGGYVEGLGRRDFIPSPSTLCSYCEFYNECRRWH